MRRIEEVIQHLEELGYHVRPEDGMLRIRKPRPIPEEGPSLLNQLKQRKQETLRALSNRPTTQPASDSLDPRPDLWEDHTAWKILLEHTRTTEPTLLPLLKGLRAGGARLVDRKTCFFLDASPVATEELSLETIRSTWLVPVTDKLRSLLRAARATWSAKGEQDQGQRVS